MVHITSGVGGYPPARWKVVAVRKGTVDLEHVKHPSASVGFPPQRVEYGIVERAMRAAE